MTVHVERNFARANRMHCRTQTHESQWEVPDDYFEKGAHTQELEDEYEGEEDAGADVWEEGLPPEAAGGDTEDGISQLASR